MGGFGYVLNPRVLAHALFLRPLVKLIFGADVEGREHLRGLNQFIMVANHNSHLDTPFLFHYFPLRQIRFIHPVAAREYFGRSWILFHLAEFLFQPVWVVRGERGAHPLAGMRDRLREGHSIVIFPEGTRGKPGEMGSFRTGVARLALEFPHVPVVPVFLSGAGKAFPKGSSFPVPMWTRAVVGEPRLVRGSARQITSLLQERVRALGEMDRDDALHPYRPPRRRDAPAVAVLGIDGSGKSTLSRTLARRLSERWRVALISDGVELFDGGEPQAIQPLLAERLRRATGLRAKKAGSLKSYKIPKLLEMMLRDRALGEVRRWYAPQLVVCDGTPLLNLTAWSRLYREDDFDESLCDTAMGILGGRDAPDPKDPVWSAFPELAALKRLGLTGLRCAEGVIFLDVEPCVSMARIHARGEARQVHETEEKLARLREGYLTVCRVLEERWQIPTRILDGSQGMEEVEEEALRALQEMPGVLPAEEGP